MDPPAGTVRIRRAQPSDVPAIEALLHASGLPRAGVREHLGAFVVAERDGQVVGSAGLELYGDAALLRSVTAQENVRGAGVGSLLTGAALAEARRAGVRDVYLFTMTAPGFFHRFGFRPLGLDGFPPVIRQSLQYRWVRRHPEGVIAMRLTLEPGRPS